jgi:hypothetical protein
MDEDKRKMLMSELNQLKTKGIARSSVGDKIAIVETNYTDTMVGAIEIMANFDFALIGPVQPYFGVESRIWFLATFRYVGSH